MAGHCERVLADALDRAAAAAFVHAGPHRDPAIAYCLRASGHANTSDPGARRGVAYVGDQWLVSTEPASLASDLAESGATGTVLTPPTIPHDAALYLEERGFTLTSSDALERARRVTESGERAEIESAQRAAGVGVHRGAALLGRAVVDDDGLRLDGDRVTRDRLRRAIAAAVGQAGGVPVRTTVRGVIEPSAPISLAIVARTTDGYHGALTRTVVVASEGGPERRAHVATTQALRAGRATVTGDEPTVAAVAAELEAEVRAYGYGEPNAVDVSVSGLGLEGRDPPREPDAVIEPPTVLGLAVGARTDGGWIRLADALQVTGDEATWLAAPSRSLEPTRIREDGVN